MKFSFAAATPIAGNKIHNALRRVTIACVLSRGRFLFLTDGTADLLYALMNG